MEQIYLTSKEKEVLQYILTHDIMSPLMTNEKYRGSLLLLEQKGLVYLRHGDRGSILQVKLSLKGQAYTTYNPQLNNPFNWKLWQFIVTIILTIATILGLFVRCAFIR